MSTLKQKRLAEVTLNHIQDPNITKGELVEKGGYGEVIQKHPKRALESAGYLEELAKFGLTRELITTALTDDIKAKPRQRVRELQLGAEILQMKKDTNTGGNVTINVLNFNGDNPTV